MLKGPIALATVRTSFVLGLRLVVQAGTLLLVARMLGPEEFGAYAGIAALAVLMGTFSTFGTHLVLLGEVSKDPSSRERILCYAVPTTLLCGCLLFSLYITVSRLWLPDAASVFIVACIGITETVLLPLFVLPATEELAKEKTARSQLLMTVPLGLRLLVASGVFLLSPKQPLAIFAGLYAATAVMTLACMKLYNADGWLRPSRWRLASSAELKHSAGYAALALTAAGPSELDKLLAVKLLPLEVSGLYAAASRVIGAATLPVTALLLSAMPRLFRHGTELSAQGWRLNSWILGSVFIYGVALAGLMWLAAPFVQWMFGPSYAGVENMLKWLCFAVPGLALRICIGSIFVTMAQPWRRAGFEIFGMVSLVSAAVFLYPKFGAVGMALALVLSEWGMAFVGGWILAFRFRMTNKAGVN
ncbi:oligosaccharide flippase family protein [Pseudomonas chengduensis]|nr:oligosaccharide flippase family protein [Pseudomonas chengduensis]MDH1623632.1 oligosaccharide flippase family protein [Pseudomonas chengduensis]